MGSRDHLFKVLVVGDAAVGKTSLVQRYSQDSFSKHYKSTVGVDFALKVLQWSDSEVVRLQLWDIAATARGGNRTWTASSPCPMESPCPACSWPTSVICPLGQ